MKKRKVAILSVGIIIVALLLEASGLEYVNDKNDPDRYRTYAPSQGNKAE